MKNIEKSASLMQKFSNKLRCPICAEKCQVVDLERIKCVNNHSFDFAKQGYVNLLTRAVKTSYDRALFTAREKVITETKLYVSLHKKLQEIIAKHAPKNAFVFDAGCGEGSHLAKIIRGEQMGLGIDIAKEGVMQAARNYREALWLVGDLANAPLANATCDVILNILSPANYDEFNRVLHQDGIVIKVVPGANYFKELRHAITKTDKKTYRNEDTVELFTNQYQLIEHAKVEVTEPLTKAEVKGVVEMSPLAWNLTDEEKSRLLLEVLTEMTIDLEIFVGMKS